MRKLILAAVLVAATLPSATAFAQGRDWDRDRGRDRYDSRGYYNEPRAIGRNERVWRDNNGQYRCRRDNGTTGLVIGGVAGALAGRAIDGGQNKTLGTVLGAAGGALLGREVDRGDGVKCR